VLGRAPVGGPYDAIGPLKRIKRLAVRELPDFLSSSEGSAYAILMDGIATQRIVDLATKRGVKYIIAARVGPVAKAPDDMSIMSFDEVKTA